MRLWQMRFWLAEDTPRVFQTCDGGRVAEWWYDLESTARWWIRWGVWSPPTRRSSARPPGSRAWPLPADRSGVA